MTSSFGFGGFILPSFFTADGDTADAAQWQVISSKGRGYISRGLFFCCLIKPIQRLFLQNYLNTQER